MEGTWVDESWSSAESMMARSALLNNDTGLPKPTVKMTRQKARAAAPNTTSLALVLSIACRRVADHLADRSCHQVIKPKKSDGIELLAALTNLYIHMTQGREGKARRWATR